MHNIKVYYLQRTQSGGEDEFELGENWIKENRV
jgi:hypothetical protein